MDGEFARGERRPREERRVRELQELLLGKGRTDKVIIEKKT